GFRKYSKNSSPSKSRRSRLTPRSTVCSKRVANSRFVTYRNGRANASAAIEPRRLQRWRKLCEFQAKNPTGRTAVRFSRLPSTRQKTGSRTDAGRGWFGIFGFWPFELDNDIVT